MCVCACARLLCFPRTDLNGFKYFPLGNVSKHKFAFNQFHRFCIGLNAFLYVEETGFFVVFTPKPFRSKKRLRNEDMSTVVGALFEKLLGS